MIIVHYTTNYAYGYFLAVALAIYIYIFIRSVVELHAVKPAHVPDINMEIMLDVPIVYVT